MDQQALLMKILLLGSNGQLGRELERQLSLVGSVHAFPRSELDITKHQKVYKVVLADSAKYYCECCRVHSS